MEASKMLSYVESLLKNMPSDWLNLTTHRLDIYNEPLAKTQFLEQLEKLFNDDNFEASALNELPTAYDYIRLGHPLSCVLEWAIAHLNGLDAEDVISFSSKTTPILAVLRKNLMINKNTQIAYTGELPVFFDTDVIKDVYGYEFELLQVERPDLIPAFNGSTIYISEEDQLGDFNLSQNLDFFIGVNDSLGSILLINGEQNKEYASEIQHVRRRETIAMTPVNALDALKHLVEKSSIENKNTNAEANKALVLESIREITGTKVKAVVASSGLSMQYAIVMGLIHEAVEHHKGKAIKMVVPPNCYGGTNDQARRVAACLDNVEVVDLPVDGNHNMVESIDTVLDQIAQQDGVPFIIAEIPTNPRVEVPDLTQLKEVLSKTRETTNGDLAVDPVFILDQTFCPNVHFLGEADILSEVRTIAYVSGSKFPSGGKCTAGYCVSNNRADALMEKIALHLTLCDNEATDHQLEVLAKQLPSMNQRIRDAYQNTREFVNFIEEHLPTAKINFVSEELAANEFTPSVFSLDLPTKGIAKKKENRIKEP
jgi:cystathionine beta-lyase/cystathionine gamma-synthase